MVAGLLVWVLTIGPSCSRSATDPVEQDALAGIASSGPLISALERHRAARGNYPQHLDELVPGFLEAIPNVSEQGGATPFVYHGGGQTFELFFLPRPSGRDQVLYRSSGEYPDRLDPGPIKLVKTLANWGWYRLIPMRQVEVTRTWKGRVGLDKDPVLITHITDHATLKKVWEHLEVREPLPNVDFQEELVLIAVIRSSLVKFMQPVVDVWGDLKPNVVAAPDQPDFRSYAICVIKREGIRTIEGKTL